MTAIEGPFPNRTLYVYYKVDLQDCKPCARLVREFQQRVLQSWPGLHAQLLQRPEASARGEETWMEVYQHADGVSDEIMQSIHQLAVTMGLPQARASEIFTTLGHAE